jgi:hypothetical protein
VIQVLTLEPNAPTSEPQRAASAVIYPESIVNTSTASFPVQHHQNKQHGEMAIQAMSKCRAAELDLRKENWALW